MNQSLGNSFLISETTKMASLFKFKLAKVLTFKETILYNIELAFIRKYLNWLILIPPKIWQCCL